MDEMYLRAFCKEFDYPEEAQQTLLEGLETIRQAPEAAAVMQRWLDTYDEKGPQTDFTDALGETREAAEKIGLCTYVSDLLLFILCSRHLWEMYQEAGYSYDLYHNAMLDLRYKLYECHNVKGVWGSFVAGWFPRFFQLTRFALGRLQFEMYTLRTGCTVEGYTFEEGCPVINVHIPSAGPLLPELVDDAFRQAAAFYGDQFGEVVPMVCSSWLLYPAHHQFLPATSRILYFQDQFHIITHKTTESREDLWRIFNTDKVDDLTALPHEKSLHKAYYDWLNAGNLPGSGYGIHLEPNPKKK